jgi:hypothetical protein
MSMWIKPQPAQKGPETLKDEESKVIELTMLACAFRFFCRANSLWLPRAILISFSDLPSKSSSEIMSMSTYMQISIIGRAQSEESSPDVDGTRAEREIYSAVH